MNWEKDLIVYRRQKARDTLDDAKLLYEHNRFFSAVNRIYYSLFYEVYALLFHNSLKTSKHSGVMALFQRHFIKTQKVNLDSGKFYSRMYEFRHKGDYDDFAEFEKEKVKEWLDKAEAFITEIEKLF